MAKAQSKAVAPVAVEKVETAPVVITQDARDLAKAMMDVADQNVNIAAMSFDLVSDCATVDALNVVRDSFKAAYAEGYKARYPANDADKCKNACNMAWSRVCSFAKDKGWERPVAENAKAAKAREARADASKGKVDGRTAKAKNTAKVEGVIVGAPSDELQQKFNTVRANPMFAMAFEQWYEKVGAAMAAIAKAA